MLMHIDTIIVTDKDTKQQLSLYCLTRCEYGKQYVFRHCFATKKQASRKMAEISATNVPKYEEAFELRFYWRRKALGPFTAARTKTDYLIHVKL